MAKETITGREKALVGSVIIVLLVLNLATLVAAYPETLTPNSGCCSNRPLAKDFSAYYTAAWRLLYDTSRVYSGAPVMDVGPVILPQPELYKYLPSLLLMIVPLLALPYQLSLSAFDALQFCLLPLVAVMVYRLVSFKGVAVTIAVCTATLLLPLPIPGHGFSLAYYWQWAEGQAKVLDTFLLVSALYLAKMGRPNASGVVLGVSAFDPRFALLAIPLFLAYNRHGLGRAIASAVAAFGASNFILFYPPTGTGFLSVVIGAVLSTPVYPYALIPIVTVVVISVADGGAIVGAVRESMRRFTGEGSD